MFQKFEFMGFVADVRINLYANLGLAQCGGASGAARDACLIYTHASDYYAQASVRVGNEWLSVSAQSRDAYETLDRLFASMEDAHREEDLLNYVESEWIREVYAAREVPISLPVTKSPSARVRRQ
jgi:hypothetical protein